MPNPSLLEHASVKRVICSLSHRPEANTRELVGALLRSFATSVASDTPPNYNPMVLSLSAAKGPSLLVLC